MLFCDWVSRENINLERKRLRTCCSSNHALYLWLYSEISRLDNLGRGSMTDAVVELVCMEFDVELLATKIEVCSGWNWGLLSWAYLGCIAPGSAEYSASGSRWPRSPRLSWVLTKADCALAFVWSSIIGKARRCVWLPGKGSKVTSGFLLIFNYLSWKLSTRIN